MTSEVMIINDLLSHSADQAISCLKEIAYFGISLVSL